MDPQTQRLVVTAIFGILAGWRIGLGNFVDNILQAAVGAAIVLLVAKVFLA